MQVTAHEDITVGVDVMGGDVEPEIVLEGMKRALEADSAIKLLAVGPNHIIDPFVARYPDRVKPAYATQVIEMDEHPAEALRAKPDSSIVVGCKAVRKGEANAFFSAGSTGAMLAAATLHVGRIKGVSRPAIVYAFPSNPPLVTLDLGANADVRPDMLVQFAKMGWIFSHNVLGVEQPRVGLLNIGEEPTKGTQLMQDTYALLKDEVTGFAGNCEGNEIFTGKFDVLVCDGFTGNVVLKTIEGTAKFIVSKMKEELMSSTRGKIGGMLAKPALSNLKSLFNADIIGGAQLLGVKGVIMIGHGSTSSEAIHSAINASVQAVKANLVQEISASISG